MFESGDYELIDFGAGRKLERFGAELLDRPSPAADRAAVAFPEKWAAATARFDVEGRGKGEWSGPLAADEWSIDLGGVRLHLQLGGAGNIGVFPEHRDTWGWIADQVQRSRHNSDRPARVLNLFAYTGGASIAAALAGAEVTHVDSSAPSVAWARRNAEASGPEDLPIRWLVEDAMKFVARECRRGNFYDGIIADPPTYGHGPKGRPFKFAQHVDELLESCGQLLNNPESTGGFMLFSCHAPGFDPSDAAAAVARVVPGNELQSVADQRLQLECDDGRVLEAGVAARWSGE